MSRITAKRNRIPKKSAMIRDATVVWFFSSFPCFSWISEFGVEVAGPPGFVGVLATEVVTLMVSTKKRPCYKLYSSNKALVNFETLKHFFINLDFGCTYWRQH